MGKVSGMIPLDKDSPIPLSKVRDAMADRSKGSAYRALLAPLIAELNRRLDELPTKDGQRRPTYEQIAHESDLDYWTVARILNGAVSSPPYVDMVRLVAAAGLSQDQAAKMIGVGDETTPGGESLDPHLVATIGILYASFPEEERTNLIRTWYKFMAALASHGVQDPSTGPQVVPSHGKIPLRRVARPRKKA